MRAQGEGEYRSACQISLLVESTFGQGEDIETVVVLRDGNGIVVSLAGGRVVAV